MLIILPPSETKRPAPEDGSPLRLERLSFPALTPLRQRVLEALIATSGQLDAPASLRVGPSLAWEVARNTQLRDLPTRAAIETYAGPLYEGLDAGSWAARTRQRAARDLVIVSALWGALRPDDPIPPYRLHICARLAGLDRLEPLWRSILPRVLTDAAGNGPILDLRSPTYQAAGRPDGLVDQTVFLRIRPSPGGPRHIGDVLAKRVRGEVARHLLTYGGEPTDPFGVAEVLAARWPLEIEQPGGRQRGWTISLQAVT